MACECGNKPSLLLTERVQKLVTPVIEPNVDFSWAFTAQTSQPGCLPASFTLPVYSGPQRCCFSDKGEA